MNRKTAAGTKVHEEDDMRKTSQDAHAEVYTLSQMPDLVRRVAAIRDHGAAMREYRKALRKYEKQRRGRPEVEGKEESLFSDAVPTGFVVKHMGRELRFNRPQKPSPRAWCRTTWGISGGTRDLGLLANGGKYNRPVNPARVRQYAEAMEAGKWRDLLTDPISITSDGEVINGQHRLAAAGQIERTGPDDGYDPKFLVLFDVSRDEIAFTDASKRTGRDLATIASKGTRKSA